PVPYYPYPMNAVNGHSPPPHQPSSPRMNGSSARGGYHHPHRGGHHYQHYPYVPPQHYVHPQASPPNLLPEPTAVTEQEVTPSSSQPQPQEQPADPSPAKSPPPLPPASPPPAVVVSEDGAISEADAKATNTPSEEQESESSPPLGSEVISAKVASEAAESTYVIWSRKPRNPSKAVGVMISARALPPSHVVNGATDLPTPPSSPKPASASIPAPSASEESHKQAAQTPSDSTEVASSSTTETTTTAPVTPTAGTPATSVTSAAPSPAKQPKALDPAKGEVQEPASHNETPQIPAADKKAEGSQAPAAEQAPAEAAAAKPAASTAKKSWASLLQSNDTASTSKSRLPTSAVVGFSIPAGIQSGPSASTPSKNASGSVRPEVLNLLNAGPSGPTPPPKIRPRGLINTGNMCFANAVLQILVYCPPFWRLFTELGKYIGDAGPNQANTTETPLVNAIIQFLKEFNVKQVEESKNPRGKGKEREEDFDELDSFIPTNVYEVMKENKRFASMVGGHQEDAEEFLGFFLDTLEDELTALSVAGQPKASDETAEQTGDGWLEVGKRNRAANTRSTRSSESPITKIFGGKFRSTLKAPHQRDSVTLEDWRSLRLDIQREQVSTIKDALQYISHPHSVEISSATRPGVVIDATRQELIESVPPILILHLKRFLYDTTVGDVVKIGKHVTFGPELEIGPDLLAKRPTHPIKYQLIGALYHHGQSASGGHYTLDVLHPNRDMSDRPRQAWIRIDDELVSDIRPEDVFGGQERDDRCAYLLFYKRVAAAWTQTSK
ncbi:hypothetical protein BC629DRAFT_1466503, partial [Irpex lacteus]